MLNRSVSAARLHPRRRLAAGALGGLLGLCLAGTSAASEVADVAAAGGRITWTAAVEGGGVSLIVVGPGEERSEQTSSGSELSFSGFADGSLPDGEYKFHFRVAPLPDRELQEALADLVANGEPPESAMLIAGGDDIYSAPGGDMMGYFHATSGVIDLAAAKKE